MRSVYANNAQIASPNGLTWDYLLDYHTGMPTRLRRLHDRSLWTNAQHNRVMAMRCFKAGLTPAQVAAEWPLVFKTSIEEGHERLGQRYDSDYADVLKHLGPMQPGDTCSVPPWP